MRLVTVCLQFGIPEEENTPALLFLCFRLTSIISDIRLSFYVFCSFSHWLLLLRFSCSYSAPAAGRRPEPRTERPPSARQHAVWCQLPKQPGQRHTAHPGARTRPQTPSYITPGDEHSQPRPTPPPPRSWSPTAGTPNARTPNARWVFVCRRSQQPITTQRSSSGTLISWGEAEQCHHPPVSQGGHAPPNFEP